MSITSDKSFFEDLYTEFSSPLSDIDCGLKCGPYNDRGVPVCCDIQLTIPAAFESEWEFLQESTDLWMSWSSSDDPGNPDNIDLQDGQVLLQCLGHKKCQRSYRTLTCRAFPFYPYLDSSGTFTGLAYYPDYRDSCWMISNLERVSRQFRQEFHQAYAMVFTQFPDSRENFNQFAAFIREEACERGEDITILDFEDGVHYLNPASEKMRQIDYPELQAYGVFEVSREMKFPDELEDC